MSRFFSTECFTNNTVYIQLTFWQFNVVAFSRYLLCYFVHNIMHNFVHNIMHTTSRSEFSIAVALIYM